MRKKISNTKGNIRRGKSNMDADTVKNWYDYLLMEFGNGFDARSKASFDKVGRTLYT